MSAAQNDLRGYKVFANLERRLEKEKSRLEEACKTLGKTAGAESENKGGAVQNNCTKWRSGGRLGMK